MVDSRRAIRAIIGVATALALAAALTTVHSALNDHQRAQAQAEQRTRDAVSVLAMHFGRTVAAADRALRDIGGRIEHDGIEVLRTDDGRKVFNALAETLPEHGGLFVFGADGNLLVGSTPGKGRPVNVHDREYWQAHEQGADFVIGPMLRGRVDDELYFTVSRAVRGPFGLSAIVVAAIEPHFIADYFTWTGDAELAFGIYRDDGAIVLRNPVRAEDIGKNVLGSRIFTDFYPKVTAANYRTISTIDGTKRIAAFAKVDGLPVVAGASMQEADVFREWWLMTTRDAALTLVGIAGIALLAWRAIAALLRESRLAEGAEAKLRLVLDAAHAAIWERDLRTGALSVSRSNYELFGQPHDTQPSMEGWRSCVHPSDVGRVEDQFRAALADRLPSVVYEYRIQHPEGVRWIYSPVTITYGTDGRATTAAGVNIDVTRLKQVEQELKQAHDRALKASRAKSRFLAAASHDLRQPAQAAALLLEAVKPHVHGPQAERILAMIEQSFASLNALLNSLLDVSRLDAGLIVPAPATLDLGELLARLADEYRITATTRGLDLRTVGTRAEIHTDPLLLERILRNLIENALRYTDHGTILLGCRRRAGAVCIQVADTGKGIPSDKLETIFEEFVQLGNSARDRSQGLGLGLSIVRRLADLLGAAVTVRSHPGRGTIFDLCLPKAACPPAAP
ncbi:MAG: ATP-binding protein [Solirubrobacterales bacterium]